MIRRPHSAAPATLAHAAAFTGLALAFAGVGFGRLALACAAIAAIAALIILFHLVRLLGDH